MVEVKEGVVVVTRNGSGDWWLYPSYKAAFEHPIYQFGDAICKGPDFIEKNWVRSEIPWLLSVLVTPVERSQILQEFRSRGWDNWKQTMNLFRHKLWNLMIDKCNIPPTDAETIVEIVIKDRKTPTLENRSMAKEQKTAQTENTEATAAEATESTETKRKPPVREPKFKPEAKITLLADKDGNPYGKDNNPKRAGSKSAERFANYVNGMTVDQAIAAGLTRADLAFDEGKKFIAIEEL